MGIEIGLLTYFVTEECCNCHISFAMPKWLQDERRKDRKSFYCPQGHGQHYTGETEEAKLRRALVNTQQQLDQEKAESKWQKEHRQQAERSLIATRGVVTRTKNRLAKGVCPCCNRTFVELQKHMRSEHPEYGDGEGNDQ